MNDLVILGAGGLARETSLLVEEINNCLPAGERWRLLGFVDDERRMWNTVQRGYPVLGGVDVLADLPADARLVCAVAEPAVKQKLVHRAEDAGRSFASLVSPAAAPASDVLIGKGVLINKGCLLTTNIELGDHVTINPGCGIGHDAVIGAFTTLMWRVNVSGAVKVGECCSLGTGAIVLQGIEIGRGSVIGAGAVVIANLPSHCTAVGVPAKVIKTRRHDRNTDSEHHGWDKDRGR